MFSSFALSDSLALFFSLSFKIPSRMDGMVQQSFFYIHGVILWQCCCFFAGKSQYGPCIFILFVGCWWTASNQSIYPTIYWMYKILPTWTKKNNVALNCSRFRRNCIRDVILLDFVDVAAECNDTITQLLNQRTWKQHEKKKRTPEEKTRETSENEQNN